MEYLAVLKKSGFFFGIDDGEIKDMLVCLDSVQRKYKKGEVVHWEGERVEEVGIVLSGCAYSTKTTTAGRVVIVTVLEPGSYVGILLAASRERVSPVTVEAQTEFSALFFPTARILGRCRKQCPKHDLLIANFLDGVAEKALHLHDRNDCLIKPTVREKALTYLRNAAVGEKGAFFIPLDREGMAKYLNVERSALSRELSHMQRDGLICYKKNEFRLLSDKL